MEEIRYCRASDAESHIEQFEQLRCAFPGHQIWQHRQSLRRSLRAVIIDSRTGRDVSVDLVRGRHWRSSMLSAIEIDSLRTQLVGDNRGRLHRDP